MKWHDAREVIPDDTAICLVKGIWRYVTIITAPSLFWLERDKWVWWNDDTRCVYPVSQSPLWIYAMELEELESDE
jgi:hypothetical protein